mmetsp:Transcript_5991/g.19550  ORF Transcript_5991/g.19550 Transcript_5991/m.19550 type:complete len:361 (-) Transcript_5991:120-1202(-)
MGGTRNWRPTTAATTIRSSLPVRQSLRRWCRTVLMRRRPSPTPTGPCLTGGPCSARSSRQPLVLVPLASSAALPPNATRRAMARSPCTLVVRTCATCRPILPSLWTRSSTRTSHFRRRHSSASGKSQACATSVLALYRRATTCTRPRVVAPSTRQQPSPDSPSTPRTLLRCVCEASTPAGANACSSPCASRQSLRLIRPRFAASASTGRTRVPTGSRMAASPSNSTRSACCACARTSPTSPPSSRRTRLNCHVARALVPPTCRSRRRRPSRSTGSSCSSCSSSGSSCAASASSSCTTVVAATRLKSTTSPRTWLLPRLAGVLPSSPPTCRPSPPRLNAKPATTPRSRTLEVHALPRTHPT